MLNLRGRTLDMRPVDRSLARNPFKIAFGMLIAGLAGATAHANMITNGSFETPTVPAGSFTNFVTGSTAITGWTVVGPEVSVVDKGYTSFGIAFPAEDGNQWLDLTGDVSNALEGVEQTVATTPGVSYDLSYFVGNVVDPPGYGTTSTVEVKVNGTTMQTSTNSMGAGTPKQVWEQFSTSFTATSASTTIEFLNLDPATDNTNGLDNVVLSPGAAAATPEPPSAITFILGLCAIGLLGYRRLTARQDA